MLVSIRSIIIILLTISPVIAAENVASDLSQYKTINKFEFKASDDSWKVKIGGRFHLDAAKYFNDGSPSLESGVEVRRARLFVSGTLKEYWNFKFQYDFVGTGKKKALDDGLKDAYIAYTGFKLLKITVGHFKEPFSLEELTSSNYYTFMERALPNTLSLGRNLGVRFDTYGDLWTASAGVFGGGLEQPTHGGHGVTGRMTFSPIHKKDEVIHLGVAGSWRSSNDDDSIRFRAQPESHITDVRLVDTGTFDAKDFFRLGIEAAAVKGPFAIQTEYLRVDANRKISSNADIDFYGYYIEGSWFLTGESRNYNFNGGNFKGVRPNNAISSNGPGAWQLAARFSHIDLSDNDVMGGEQDNVSVGINWYPTTNIRFIANYIKVLEVDGGTLDGNEPSVFQMRAQIYW